MGKLKWVADKIALLDQSVCKAISVFMFCFAWTHFGLTDDWKLFFHLLAVCCCMLFGSLTLPVKYRRFDRGVNIVAGMFTFSNLVDEFFGDPQKLQANEYVFAILTIILVIRGRKRTKLDKRT